MRAYTLISFLILVSYPILISAGSHSNSHHDDSPPTCSSGTKRCMGQSAPNNCQCASKWVSDASLKSLDGSSNTCYLEFCQGISDGTTMVATSAIEIMNPATYQGEMCWPMGICLTGTAAIIKVEGNPGSQSVTYLCKSCNPQATKDALQKLQEARDAQAAAIAKAKAESAAAAAAAKRQQEEKDQQQRNQINNHSAMPFLTQPSPDSFYFGNENENENDDDDDSLDLVFVDPAANFVPKRPKGNVNRLVPPRGIQPAIIN